MSIPSMPYSQTRARRKSRRRQAGRSLRFRPQGICTVQKTVKYVPSRCLARGSTLRRIMLAVSTLLLMSAVLGLAGEQAGSDEEISWTNANPAAAPSLRHGHAMAYDTESDRVILVGGHNGRAFFPTETWAYDFENNTWTKMEPATRPSGRDLPAMAYDSQSDRAILFGGTTGFGNNFGDTWAYDFNTNAWTNLNPTTGPASRANHAMAYDAESDRVILFGGGTGGGTETADNETWAYDFDNNTWTSMNPATGPSRRVAHAMAYDSQSDRVILFGGSGSDETWAYDFDNNSWTKMEPAAGPSSRNKHAMAYDAESDRIVLFGGGAGASLPPPSSALRDETWAYDYNTNTWTNMTPAMGPDPRFAHSMAYDGESDRVILFGGGVETVLDNSNETWAYDFDNNSWTKMEPDTNPTISITSPAEGSNLASTSVTVSGTASDDVAVEEVELSTDGTNWVLATGTASWSGTLTLIEGQNNIYAMATDSAGNTAIVNIAVTVDPVMPTANAGEDQTASVGATVPFDASGSSDNVGIVSYEWDFGDGTTGTGETTTHIYADLGTHTVTLTVSDAAGNTDTDSLTVTVGAEPFQISSTVVTSAVIGVVAAVTAVAALLILRSRRKRKGEG